MALRPTSWFSPLQSNIFLQIRTVFSQFFDADAELSHGIYESFLQYGENTEFKASFFFNEIEGDLLNFESVNSLREEAEYRYVGDSDQLKSTFNYILQNINQIENQLDVKNAYESFYILISFRTKDLKVNFIFAPVFQKTFKISENYSTWVQLKSILKNLDTRSPTHSNSAISKFFKQNVPGNKLNLIAFVESGPDKYQQATTVLDESTRLLADLRGSVKRKLSDSIGNQSGNHIHQSDQSSANIDETGMLTKEIIQEVNDFILQSEETLRDNLSPEKAKRAGDEIKRQIAILEEKLDIANDSIKSPVLQQRLARCQKRLDDLKDSLEAMQTTSFRSPGGNGSAMKVNSEVRTTEVEYNRTTPLERKVPPRYPISSQASPPHYSSQTNTRKKVNPNHSDEEQYSSQRLLKVEEYKSKPTITNQK